MRFSFYIYIIVASCLFDSQVQQGSQILRNAIVMFRSAKHAVFQNVVQLKDWTFKHFYRIRNAVNKTTLEKAVKMPTKEELKEKAKKIREHLKHLQETMLMDPSADDQALEKLPKKEATDDGTSKEKKKTRIL